MEQTPVELHGVIVLDGALVLETADAVEVGWSGCGPPGGRGVRRRTSELGVVARDETVQHALGLGERAGLSQSKFDDEAILEGAKKPLDAPLRLRGMGADPADAEFLKGAADLGRVGPALKLLGQGEWDAGIAVKDPVTVGVRGAGKSVTPDELTEEQEIAVGVLFQAEDATEDLARRVVDGRVEDESRPPLFEPGVMAAVHLDEEASLRHAVSAAAMARGTAGAGAADPGGAEEPLHRPTRDPQALAFGEQLGEVVIIHARIGGAGQGEDAGPDGLREAP